MARIVLVQMPFRTLCTPSIALSLLRGVLENDGHETEVRYLNAKYARRVGVNLYRAISDVVAADTLYGEMVFSAMPLGASDDPEAGNVARRHMESRNIPGWLIRALPQLAEEARNLVLDESLAIARGDDDINRDVVPELRTSDTAVEIHIVLGDGVDEVLPQLVDVDLIHRILPQAPCLQSFGTGASSDRNA